jgi:hypothetical protein
LNTRYSKKKPTGVAGGLGGNQLVRRCIGLPKTEFQHLAIELQLPGQAPLELLKKRFVL